MLLDERRRAAALALIKIKDEERQRQREKAQAERTRQAATGAYRCFLEMRQPVEAAQTARVRLGLCETKEERREVCCCARHLGNKGVVGIASLVNYDDGVSKMRFGLTRQSQIELEPAVLAFASTLRFCRDSGAITDVRRWSWRSTRLYSGEETSSSPRRRTRVPGSRNLPGLCQIYTRRSSRVCATSDRANRQQLIRLSKGLSLRRRRLLVTRTTTRTEGWRLEK